MAIQIKQCDFLKGEDLPNQFNHRVIDDNEDPLYESTKY